MYVIMHWFIHITHWEYIFHYICIYICQACAVLHERNMDVKTQYIHTDASTASKMRKL